jgi:hypothetical protein
LRKFWAEGVFFQHDVHIATKGNSSNSTPKPLALKSQISRSPSRIAVFAFMLSTHSARPKYNTTSESYKKEQAMATQRVSDMTLDELNQLVENIIDRRLQALLKPKTTRTTAEILASIDKNRIVPPPGAKSAREMLREDRDA